MKKNSFKIQGLYRSEKFFLRNLKKKTPNITGLQKKILME